MRNRIMILCTFCAIAIFSSAQEKFSIRGIADEELNNQLLYLCLMGDGEKAKEVVLDSTTVEEYIMLKELEEAIGLYLELLDGLLI